MRTPSNRERRAQLIGALIAYCTVGMGAMAATLIISFGGKA
jgi:hypothetical protein